MILFNSLFLSCKFHHPLYLIVPYLPHLRPLSQSFGFIFHFVRSNCLYRSRALSLSLFARGGNIGRRYIYGRSLFVPSHISAFMPNWKAASAGSFMFDGDYDYIYIYIYTVDVVVISMCLYVCCRMQGGGAACLKGRFAAAPRTRTTTMALMLLLLPALMSHASANGELYLFLLLLQLLSRWICFCCVWVEKRSSILKYNVWRLVWWLETRPSGD